MAASSTVTAAATATAAAAKDAALQEELALPILLTDRIIKAAGEAESSRAECADIAAQAAELSQKLRATVRLITVSSYALYDRPIHCIVAETRKNLDRALTLVRKCKHAGILRHVFLTITSSAADFKKVSIQLESSIADFRWLLSIYSDGDGDGDGGGHPPVVKSDPIIGWVWSSIAILQPNRRLGGRIEAANDLGLYAKSNDRYRKVIVEENGVSALLRLLKDGNCGGSCEGQVAAATALIWLSEGDLERCRAITSDNHNLGVPIIVQVLGESSMSVQIVVSELVAKIAEVDPVAREEFGRENVLKPLISCLIYDIDMDEYRKYHSGGGKSSLNLHSVVQTAKNRNYDYIDHNNNNGSSRGSGSNSSYHTLRSSSSLGGGGGNYSKKDRENESPEVKEKLKTKCALALWRLCENSLMNCQKIAEPKGLFCLSKMIETEKGELRLNCLMTILEVARAAEGNADLRKAAWKPSSPPTKVVLDQLKRVVKEESESEFLIPAVKAIGCLARIFGAKETGIISSLVGKLGDMNLNVAIEATLALTKFVSPDNHIRVEHSMTIIEFNGVLLLMKLLSVNDRVKRDGLVLLCYLSMNVGNSTALVEAQALRILESALRPAMGLNAEFREIVSKAMNNLLLYQEGAHSYNHGIAMV